MMILLRNAFLIVVGWIVILTVCLAINRQESYRGQIVFTYRNEANNYTDKQSIWSVQADGSHEHHFVELPPTKDGYPNNNFYAWSANGQWLVIGRDLVNIHHEIYRVSVGGTALNKIIEAEGALSGLDLSPDNRQIILTMEVDIAHQLYILHEDLTLEQATNDPSYGSGGWTGDVQWIEQGNWWFYTDGDLMFRDLVRAHPYSEEVQVLTPPSLGRKISSFDVSPDGEWVVFVVYEEIESVLNTNLYLMRSNGLDQERLSSWTGDEINPSWSPDGQWIVFASNQDGDFDLYKMRSDGSDIQQITNMAGDELSPSWSPFSGKKWHIWRLVGIGLVSGALVMIWEIWRYWHDKDLKDLFSKKLETQA